MRERRGAKAAALPLAVIGAVTVLPTYRSCGTDELENPVHFASSSLFDASWVLPVFLFGALLALLTLRALERGEVDRLTRRLGLVSVALFGLSVTGVGVAMTVDTGGEWPWLAAGVVASAAAAGLVRRARGMGPWQIWEHLLAAYTVIAAVSVPVVMLGGDVLRGNTAPLGPGAWLLLGALVALWGILGAAIVRARR